MRTPSLWIFAFVLGSLASASALAQSTGMKRVPIGYAPRPDGVRLEMTSPLTDGDGFATRITNLDARTVTGLQFSAIVEQVGTERSAVRVLTSPLWTMTLATGQSEAISAPWLTSTEVDALIAAAAPRRLQMFLAPTLVRFSDGSQWQLPIDETARDFIGAMRRPIPDVPRALLAATVSPAARSLCRDDINRTYSAGAMVPIRNESGRVARCIDGRWIETDAQGQPMAAR